MHVPVVYTRLLGGAGHDDLATFLSLPQDRRQEALRRALASVPDAPGSYWPADTPEDILARLSARGNKIGRLPYIDSFFVKLEQALDLKKTVVSVLKSARGTEQALDFDDLHTAQAVSFLINPGKDVIQALDESGSRWLTMVGKGPFVDTGDGKYRVDIPSDLAHDDAFYLRFERALRYLFPERTIAGLLDLDFLAEDGTFDISFETEEKAKAAAALIEGAVIVDAKVRAPAKELTKWGDHTALVALLPYRLIVVTRFDYGQCASIAWSTKDRCSFTGTDGESLAKELFEKDDSTVHPVTPTTGVYVFPTVPFPDYEYRFNRVESFTQSYANLSSQETDRVLLQRLQDRYSLHVWPSILYVGEPPSSMKTQDVAIAAKHPLLDIPYDIIVIADRTIPVDWSSYIDMSTVVAVPMMTRQTELIHNYTYGPAAFVALANGDWWTLLTCTWSRYWKIKPGFYLPFPETLDVFAKENTPFKSSHSNIIDCLHEAYTKAYEMPPRVTATDLESFSVDIKCGINYTRNEDDIWGVYRVRLSKATNSVSWTNDFQPGETVRTLGVRWMHAGYATVVVECVIDDDEGRGEGPWTSLNSYNPLGTMIASMIACAKEEDTRSRSSSIASSSPKKKS